MLGWILAGIIFLLILVYILIQVPGVQQFAKNKVVAFLENKLKTKVEIDRLSIAFPKRIVLKGVYFEDQQKDTLLSGKELRVDIALLKLLQNEVDVEYIELNGIYANIYRVLPDTVFNFSYIVDAFVTEQAQPAPVDSTNLLKFSVDEIVLNNIRARFKDDVTGNDVNIQLKKFNTTIDKFDPYYQVFNFNKIELGNATATIKQYKPLFAQTSINDTSVAASAPMPSLKVNELNVQNTKVTYGNSVSAVYADFSIGEFITHPTEINLQTIFYELNDINLKNSNIAVTLGRPVTNITKAKADSIKQKVADVINDSAWRFKINRIALSNNAFSFYDSSQPKISHGIDYGHLKATAIELKASDLLFTPVAYSGQIDQAAFKEKSGFNLKKLHTDFSYTDTAASLENLLVETNRTVIRDKVILRYPSIEKISTNPGLLYINADLNKCTIDLRDIVMLAPQMASTIKTGRNCSFYLNTSVKGYVNNLSIPFFQMRGLGGTVINASANIKGLPDAINAVYNVNIQQLKTSRSDIFQLVPQMLFRIIFVFPKPLQHKVSLGAAQITLPLKCRLIRAVEMLLSMPPYKTRRLITPRFLPII